MGLCVDLKRYEHIAGVESLAPDRFDRLPLPAAARHFTRFGGETNFRRAFVTGNQLDRQPEGRNQQLGSIIGCITGRDAAEFYRGLGISQGIEGRDAARFGERAGNVILRRDADIFKFARVELDTGFPDHLIDDLVAMKVENRQPVGLGNLIYVIGRYQAGGAGHIFDDDRRVPGNLLAQVTGDQARIAVESAAGGETDNKPDGFSLVMRRGIGPNNPDEVEHRNQEEPCEILEHESFCCLHRSFSRWQLTMKSKLMSTIVKHFPAQLSFPGAAAVRQPIAMEISNLTGASEAFQFRQGSTQNAFIALPIMGRTERAADSVIDKGRA